MSNHFCMLAQPYDPARVKRWPVAVETKLDGFRLLVLIEPGIYGATPTVSFLSRSGKAFTSLDHLRPALEQFGKQMVGRIVLDGEVTSGSFKETSSSVRRKSVQATDAVFTVFDSFFMGGENTQYSQRYSRTVSWVLMMNHPQIIHSRMTTAENADDVMDLYQQARLAGHEGIIVKDLLAPYEYKRSYFWMKIKGYESADLKVVAVEEGTGKHKGRMGAIHCSLGKGEGRCVAVGTGFTDAQRTDIWANQDGVVGRIAEVGYHEKTPDGSLRHPRFIRWRDTMHKGAKE